MADVTVWSPSVEKRQHPFGERGVFSSLEEVCRRAKKGAVSPKVRMWAIEQLDRARKTRGLKMNTEKERAEVLLKAVQQKLWVPDPVGTEWMAGSHLMACDPAQDGVCFRGGDCFPQGTLVLGEGHELVAIEDVKPGMKIWGLDRWSKVEAVAYKGVLPVDVITLNNGSEVKLTEGHKVYVLDCSKHPMLGDQDGPLAVVPGDGRREPSWAGGGCACSIESRVEKRVRVREVREGMVLTTPERGYRVEVERIDRDVEKHECWDIQTDDHRVFLHGSDVTVSNCDDLVVLLGACFVCVGLYTCIVGHAYNKQKQIQHVLTSVFAGGRWYYADPSTDLRLGECVDFSRERIYSLPNVQMLCDRDVCFTSPRDFNPEQNNFVARGDFVGVNGVPDFAWIVDSAQTHDGRMLGMLSGNVEKALPSSIKKSLKDNPVTALMLDKDFCLTKSCLREYSVTAARVGGAAGAAAACAAFGAGGASALCSAIGAWVGDVLGKLALKLSTQLGPARGQTLEEQEFDQFKDYLESDRPQQVAEEMMAVIAYGTEREAAVSAIAESGASEAAVSRLFSKAGVPTLDQGALWLGWRTFPFPTDALATMPRGDFNYLEKPPKTHPLFAEWKIASAMYPQGVSTAHLQEVYALLHPPLLQDALVWSRNWQDKLRTSYNEVRNDAAQASFIDVTPNNNFAWVPPVAMRESGGPKSSSSGAGWLVVAAIAGGIAWWLWG